MTERGFSNHSGQGPLTGPMKSLVERAVASVVLIIRSTLVEGGPPMNSIGSGFCWVSARGQTLIVTNAHVVEDPDSERSSDNCRYAVSFGGKGGSRFHAELVGTHPWVDIAVLRAPIAPLPQLLQFRQGEVWPGEEVVAVGNPSGYTTSFSKGIVSAVDRENFATPNGGPIRALQTDATVNRGNSGGPLVGMDGAVVGVNAHGDGETLPYNWPVLEAEDPKEGPLDFARTAEGKYLLVRPIVDLQGVNFAVPAEIAEAAAREIVEAGTDGVAVGWLGVHFDSEQWKGSGGEMSRTVQKTMGDSVGLELLRDPEKGSPADAAGLAKGDVIVSLGEEPVDHPGDLSAWGIMRSWWDRESPLRFLRDGRMHEVTVRGREMRIGKE